MAFWDGPQETKAQRFTRLRDEAGLTQAQLAEKLTSVAGAGTVGGWESTEGKMPRLETLVELSDLYGVELYFLVTGRGPEKRVAPEEAAIRLRVVERALTGDTDDLTRLLQAAEVLRERPLIEQAFVEVDALRLGDPARPRRDRGGVAPEAPPLPLTDPEDGGTRQVGKG